MPWVEATEPPKLTGALAEQHAIGVDQKTRPLASILPKISLLLLPMTRFNATAALPGWLKLTRSPAPMLKSFQSMISLSVFWLIDIACWLASFWMSALPPATFWPLGRAWADGTAASPSKAAAAAVAASAGLPRLPCRRAPSCATCQHCWAVFQTVM